MDIVAHSNLASNLALFNSNTGDCHVKLKEGDFKVIQSLVSFKCPELANAMTKKDMYVLDMSMYNPSVVKYLFEYIYAHTSIPDSMTCECCVQLYGLANKYSLKDFNSEKKYDEVIWQHLDVFLEKAPFDLYNCMKKLGNETVADKAIEGIIKQMQKALGPRQCFDALLPGGPDRPADYVYLTCCEHSPPGKQGLLSTNVHRRLRHNYTFICHNYYEDESKMPVDCEKSLCCKHGKVENDELRRMTFEKFMALPLTLQKLIMSKILIPKAATNFTESVKDETEEFIQIFTQDIPKE